MNMWKRIKKCISVILVFALFVQLFPLSAFAVETSSLLEAAPQEATMQTEVDVKDGTPNKTPAIAGEVEELRGESEKHFLMEDGTYRAVTYEFPVHYLDEDENWQEIDNTLQAVATFDGNGSNQYVSVNGDVYKAFAADLESGQLFTTGTGDYAVSLSLQNDLDEETTLAPSDTEILPTEPTESESTEELPVTDPTDPSEAVTEPETLPTEATEAETATELSVADPMEPSEAVTGTETAEPTELEGTLHETETGSTYIDRSESTEPDTAPTVSAEALLPEEIVEPVEKNAQLSFNQDVQAVVVNPSDMSAFSIMEESGQAYMPANIQAEVVYAEVFKDVDFTYTSYSNHIKESIVLYSADAESSYSFVLNLAGLVPVMNEDSSISLVSESGEEIFLIPAPYMFDDAGEMSNAVHYTVTELEDGAYLLTVEADKAWLQDSNRAFPVTIDPTLIDKVTWANQGVSVIYTTSGDPDEPHYDYQNVYFGYSTLSNVKEMQMYAGFDKLPTVPGDCEVVSAGLYLYHCDYSYVTLTSFVGHAYAVTDPKPSKYSSYHDWTYYMTWNNKPTCSDTVLDYVTFQNGQEGFVSWDLTPTIKSWYADSSLTRAIGIKMKNASQCNSAKAASVTFLGYGSTKGPMFVVAYRNMNGLEPYYSYQSLGADAAGTMHIADYTGNLTTVTPLVSFASTINPFSLNLIYNSSYFTKSSVDNYTVAKNLGLGMYLGSGMSLDVIQKVEKVQLQYETGSTTTKTYLKYTDGDGTAHYFAKDTSKDSTGTYYYDEDGLGLKAKETSTGNFLISDDKDNEMVFTNGFLTTIRDSNDNEIQIVYALNSNGLPSASGDRISKIVQKNKGGSAITVATFAYKTYENVANYLSSVTDYANNVYTFDYSCYKLLRVCRNGTVLVQYEVPYDSATNRFVNPVKGLIDPETGYAVHVEYDSQKRVSKYYETSGSYNQSTKKYTSSSQGVGATITRTAGSQTTYRNWGLDRIANNSDDILTTYSFDYAGRTVNAYSTDTGSNILGASNAVYSGSGTTSKTNNRTLRTATIGVAAMQMVRNGGFESSATDLEWTIDKASNSGMSAAVRQELVRTGSNAFKTWVTETTPGVIGGHRETNILAANTTYTFSAYVNTSNATYFNKNGSGIYLKVVDPNGKTYTGEPLNYKTSGGIDGGWTRISLTFQTAAKGVHTLYLCNEGIGPCVYFDDIQLETGDAPSNVNLLENGGMNYWGYSWNFYGTGYFKNYCGVNSTADGAYSLQLNGESASRRYAYQSVTLNQPGTQTYVLSGWAKANAVPDNITEGDPKKDKQAVAKDVNKQFGLRAILTYADNTKEYHYVAFHTSLTDWQFVSTPIVPKSTTKTVASIQVECAYDKNANFAYFDNISLVKEVAQTMKYDKDGNLISVKSTGNSGQSSNYSNGDLIKEVTGEYGTFEYKYDTKHNVTEAYNNLLSETLTYDASGNNTGFTLTKKGDTSKKITTSTAYTADDNRTASVTDHRGNTTTYAYGNSTSIKNGTPTSATDANGTAVVSSYDSTTGRMKSSWINGVVSTGFAYENGIVTEISRGGYDLNVSSTDKKTQYYYFTYDGFGNQTQMAVGNRWLTKNTYGAKNSLLTRQTYANGAYTDYTYDKLGRTTKTTTSSGDEYTYAYTGDGQLGGMTDKQGNTAYQYTYDTLGRLICTSRTGAQTLQGQYTYDDNNRLTRIDYNIPDSIDSSFASYYYNNGSSSTIPTGVLTKMSMFSKEWINYGYDSLGRMSTRKIASILNENYSYLAGATASNTTTMVSGKKITDQSGTVLNNFTYAYDKLGNITTERDTTNYKETTYTYDKQGQLLTAQSGDQRYTYTYDTYGNIRSKSDDIVGLYSRGSMRFTYGDSDWLDLLTGVSVTSENGNTVSGTITYDASGNPLSYFNGANYTMTWRNGKELNTLTTNGKTTGYEYDVDGLRTRKTNSDGSYSDYYWLGKLLLAEQRYDKNGSCTYTLRFSYDENDSPIGVAIKSGSATTFTPYYYAKNVQGDVIGLYQWNYSSTGTPTSTKVATYSYDPWGNFLGAYNASGSKITAATNAALLNPIRYRGYYYDSETGFYYVSSRYYDPEIGRFINADDAEYLGADGSVLSYNLFAYCMNDPVNRFDVDGNWSLPNWAKVAIGAVALAGAVALTVATGGGAAAVAVGVAKVVGSVAVSTAVSAGVGYLNNGKQGAIDGACNGFMFGSLSACGGAAFKYCKVRAATTGTPNSMGRAGEKLAGIDSNGKTRIKINNRTRIPDKLTHDVLKEVKNVKYISNTQQLRDFADYAHATNRALQLWVRPTTKVAKTVLDAGWEIHYLW